MEILLRYQPRRQIARAAYLLMWRAGVNKYFAAEVIRNAIGDAELQRIFNTGGEARLTPDDADRLADLFIEATWLDPDAEGNVIPARAMLKAHCLLLYENAHIREERTATVINAAYGLPRVMEFLGDEAHPHRGVTGTMVREWSRSIKAGLLRLSDLNQTGGE